MTALHAKVAYREPKEQHRRSIRWFAYDYAQAGAYFVTICTADRQGPLGQVEGVEVRLSALGQIAAACWRAIPDHFADVELDAFVVMPNHVHGIVVIGDRGARHASPLQGAAKGPGRRSVGSIVGAYKSAVARRIHETDATPAAAVWQRNYYEHVIRSEQQLSRIRRYIEANPANWMLDHENPQGNCYGQSEQQQFFCY